MKKLIKKTGITLLTLSLFSAFLPCPAFAEQGSSSISYALSTWYRDNWAVLLIILTVLILVSSASLIILIFFTPNEDGTKFVEIDTSRLVMLKRWECPSCGAMNRADARFCSNCGSAKAKNKPEE